MASKRKSTDISTVSSHEHEPVDITKVKVGDIISNTEYFCVTGFEHDCFLVQTLCGTKRIAKSLLKYQSYKSTSEIKKTEKVCRSKIIEIIRDDVKSHSFSVEFTKKNGDSRKMVCYLKQFSGLFGRSDVYELITKKNDSFETQTRQIDHRTITKLIFDGVCYVCK